MGGGKGGGSSSVPTVDTTALMAANSQAMQAYMSNMNSSNNAMLSSMQQQENILATQNIPEVTKAPTPVWTEIQKQIAAKSLADYTLEQSRKIGRNSTLLASPLLDEDSPETVSSMLVGK